MSDPTDSTQVPAGTPAIPGSIRAKILAGADFASKSVTLGPPWDVTVEIRSMDAADRAAFLGRLAERTSDPEHLFDIEGAAGTLLTDLYPQLIVKCTYNPDNGELVFSDADLPELEHRNGMLVAQLGDAICALNGLAANPETGADGIDELGKASTSSTPTGGASTVG